MGNIRVSYSKNTNGSAEVLEENNFYSFGLKHEGYNALEGNPSYQYQYNGKELQTETGWSDYGARMYMSDIGRWGVIDPLAEQMRRYSPYNYAYNNPIRFIDADGRKPTAPDQEFQMNAPAGGFAMYFANGGKGDRASMMKFIGVQDHIGEMFDLVDQASSGGGGGGSSTSSAALIDRMWSLGEGTWTNTGYGFESNSHISLGYNGSYISLNTTLEVLIPEIIMNGKGNDKTWNNASNIGYNSYLMMSKITGALGNWNLNQRRDFLHNRVLVTGADKVERNFYFMFGGALAAPFAMSYIATLGGESAASYLQGAVIRGVTDMALQQTIKGSIDWKQTGINAFIGGGSGLSATKVNWLNYGGNMINNFGTSIYDGTFNHDFTMNSMKALTGVFGMGVSNYNGLTNGYLNGYFGTVLLPGLYFNTTDIVIEQNKNKK